VQDESAKPKSYSLEMAYGLKEITDRAKVFLVTKPTANLLSDERVKAVAANYGFTSVPETIAEEVYRFTKNTPLEWSRNQFGDFIFHYRVISCETRFIDQ
jgi:hypothetical protein